jgi:hypothetical protein
MKNPIQKGSFKYLKSYYATVAVLFMITTFTSVPVFADSSTLEKVLPAPSYAAGWGLGEKISLYTKDNLFDRTDGEAEMYFPYGFDLMASARYISKQNTQYAVEADVYKMGSPLDAFGIYANYRRSDDEDASIGADGTIAPSQLLFYQDRYFVRLQATGTLSVDKEVFLSCARAISHNLPADDGKPKELDVLVTPSVVSKSVRYIPQSLLGYPFLRRGLMVDAASRSGGMQIFIVLDETPDAARKYFNLYLEYLQKSRAEVSLNAASKRTSFEAVDPLYRNVLVEMHGRYLYSAIRIRDISSARHFMEQLREMP